jgi:hypothetical protein
MERRELAELSLDALSDWMSDASPDSQAAQIASAEFSRRQTALQIEATQAAIDTAEFTRRSALYMLLSVIVVAIAALVSAVITVLQWREAHQQVVEAHEQLRLSVQPSVDFDKEDDEDDPNIGIAIENNGPGTAIIRTITYFVDQKKVDDINDSLEFFKIDSRKVNYHYFDEDDSFKSGGTMWLVSYKHSKDPDEEQIGKFIDFFQNHLGIEVKYCSTVNECWTKCSTKNRCGS